jgi:hypothetical protein
MITNDRFYEVLGRIPSEERHNIRRRRNPKWVKKGERDYMFLELPHNPLRIVERAAELARRLRRRERCGKGCGRGDHGGIGAGGTCSCSAELRST